jgi:DNA-binding PadR family transcriptional regulator
METYPI